MRLSNLVESLYGPPYKSAVAIVIKDGKQVLLGKSTAEDDRGGTWCFPGGGIKSGESPEKGAARECSEETGISASPEGDAFTIYNMPNVAFVICIYKSGEPKPNHEFSDMRWIDFHDIEFMEDLFEPNRYIIDNLNAHYPMSFV